MSEPPRFFPWPRATEKSPEQTGTPLDSATVYGEVSSGFNHFLRQNVKTLESCASRHVRHIGMLQELSRYAWQKQVGVGRSLRPAFAVSELGVEFCRLELVSLYRLRTAREQDGGP